MSSLPRIIEALPLVKVLRYSHLGIGVVDIGKSLDFYRKIGFNLKTNAHLPVVVMQNRGGLELHLFKCDKGVGDENNLLMDYATKKYPGHTHASFSVENVVVAKTYLESEGLVISGERKFGDRLLAVFTRDPDRTTYEFERNFGEPLNVEVTAETIGYPQSIDHIGIRISKPEESWVWYAQNLGFVFNAKKYEQDKDMLKNGPPWIARTESGVDINFIINANECPSENILLAGGLTRPGIIYASYVVENVTEAEQALRAEGIVITRDCDLLHNLSLSCLVDKIQHSDKSIFLQDSDHNVLRLIEES